MTYFFYLMYESSMQTDLFRLRVKFIHIFFDFRVSSRKVIKNEIEGRKEFNDHS